MRSQKILSVGGAIMLESGYCGQAACVPLASCDCSPGIRLPAAGFGYDMDVEVAPRALLIGPMLHTSVGSRERENVEQVFREGTTRAFFRPKVR